MPPKRSPTTSKSNSNPIKSTSGKSHYAHDKAILELIFSHDYQVKLATGDGNCLFRSLSTCICDSEAYHLVLRDIITTELCRAADKALLVQEELDKENAAKLAKNGRKSGGKSNSRASNIEEDVDEELPMGRTTRAAKSSWASKCGTAGVSPCEISAKKIDPNLPIPDYHFFVVGSFQKYCTKMAQSGVWGGHLEIQAFTNIFGVAVLVLQDQFPPIAVNPDKSLWDAPNSLIYLLYRGECHYDACIPTHNRIDHASFDAAAANKAKTIISNRYPNFNNEKFPYKYSLCESKKNSWWLTPEAKKQCQLGDGHRKYNYDIYSSSSDDDDDDDNEDDEDDETILDPNADNDDKDAAQKEQERRQRRRAARMAKNNEKFSQYPFLHLIFPFCDDTGHCSDPGVFARIRHSARRSAGGIIGAVSGGIETAQLDHGISFEAFLEDKMDKLTISETSLDAPESTQQQSDEISMGEREEQQSAFTSEQQQQQQQHQQQQSQQQPQTQNPAFKFDISMIDDSCIPTIHWDWHILTAEYISSKKAKKDKSKKKTGRIPKKRGKKGRKK